MNLFRCPLVLLLVVILLGAASPARSAGLSLVDAGGGSLSPPVIQGDYLYVGTGATISVWNFATPASPVLASRSNAAPAPGPVRGLALVGGYLYASWDSPAGIGGLRIYSLADPAHPALLKTIDRYIDQDYRDPRALAVSGHYLLVGDFDNGLVVLDATDPLAPAYVTQNTDVNAFDNMLVDGSHLLIFGNSFIGGLISVVDIATPSAPVALGYAGLDADFLRAVMMPGYAVAVGNALGVYDLSDAAHITQVFSTPIDTALQAIRNGNELYLLGASGLQVWDFSTPSAPTLLRTIALGDALFDVDRAANTPFGPLALTHTDEGILFDATNPAQPTLRARFALPFGVAAHSADFDAGHVYFAEEGYGIGVADAATLAPLGRYDAALPPEAISRDMEDIAVDGGRAYVAAWGFGVLIADVSDPAHPAALGSFEFPFASTIEAHGNIVYAASATNGGILRILDVSDAAHPQQLGALATDQTMDLTVRGNYAYLADEDGFGGGGGLRVIDVSNPSSPALLGHYADCNYAGGVDVSADGNTSYLACEDGTLQVLDTTDKANPLLLGSVFIPGAPNLPDYNVAHSVVVAGTTAYVGNENGVDEVDVSNPHAPLRTLHHETGAAVYKVTRTNDARVLAFAGEAGTFVYSRDALFANGFE